MPNLRLVQFEEATLLGAPLFIKALPSALDVKVEALKRLTSNLDFRHAHDALFLLKNCLAIPKLQHVLRCSPTWTANDQLLAFDEVLRRTLESVCNIKMDGAVWSQATLPTSKVVLASDGPKISHYLPSCPPPLLLLILSAPWPSPCSLPMRSTALVISRQAWIMKEEEWQSTTI